ncbi:hypothetical protein [Chitinophaga ginsengisoli]|uniref:Uncharacterized protein n=1 Tax=Chitinophaga ginsengisoli TaxID=363837 RepID=A0A2P8GKN1_9BACT|nr:hypothetical protein [Chitinophaga ginsengisoli]PSL34528.1 hypothetical protein CLV42_10299 [Chitinophaga ginsengisoli]
MRQFLDLVNTRNKQILHADAIATRINEIDSEIGSIHTEVLSTKGRLLETENPYLPANIIFFEKANNRII